MADVLLRLLSRNSLTHDRTISHARTYARARVCHRRNAHLAAPPTIASRRGAAVSSGVIDPFCPPDPQKLITRITSLSLYADW